jgi:hypothetical protein
MYLFLGPSYGSFSGFTSASFNDKKSVIKKINTASTRTSDLGSMKKRNGE